MTMSELINNDNVESFIVPIIDCKDNGLSYSSKLKFIVKWPVSVVDFNNSEKHFVNFRTEKFSSYEEAKRFKAKIIYHLDEIRTSLSNKSVSIEISEG